EIFRFDRLSTPYYAVRRGDESARPKLERALANLDALLEAQPFLTGAEYGLADSAYVPWSFRAEWQLALERETCTSVEEGSGRVRSRGPPPPASHRDPRRGAAGAVRPRRRRRRDAGRAAGRARRAPERRDPRRRHRGVDRRAGGGAGRARAGAGDVARAAARCDADSRRARGAAAGSGPDDPRRAPSRGVFRQARVTVRPEAGAHPGRTAPRGRGAPRRAR